MVPGFPGRFVNIIIYIYIYVYKQISNSNCSMVPGEDTWFLMYGAGFARPLIYIYIYIYVYMYII